MAISYPRDLPTATGIANITLRAVNQTAMTMSPFTYKQQIHNHAIPLPSHSPSVLHSMPDLLRLPFALRLPPYVGMHYQIF